MKTGKAVHEAHVEGRRDAELAIDKPTDGLQRRLGKVCALRDGEQWEVHRPRRSANRRQ
jgi:hypothetical protein